MQLNYPEYYRIFIKSGGRAKYYYDFKEAEQFFRETVDQVVCDTMKHYDAGGVKEIIEEYLGRAKSELLKKVNLLQTTVKKNWRGDSDKKLFKEETLALYQSILQAGLPVIEVPHFLNFDSSYNGNYRFYSKRDCEKAAECRRQRAHKDGISFLENIHLPFCNVYQKAFIDTMTAWKRDVLSIYDLAGIKYPSKDARVQMGKRSVSISFSNHEDVLEAFDESISEYVKNNLSFQACYEAVEDISYIGASECEISIRCNSNDKETLFGGYKEDMSGMERMRYCVLSCLLAWMKLLFHPLFTPYSIRSISRVGQIVGQYLTRIWQRE